MVYDCILVAFAHNPNPPTKSQNPLRRLTEVHILILQQMRLSANGNIVLSVIPASSMLQAAPMGVLYASLIGIVLRCFRWSSRIPFRSSFQHKIRVLYLLKPLLLQTWTDGCNNLLVWQLEQVWFGIVLRRWLYVIYSLNKKQFYAALECFFGPTALWKNVCPQLSSNQLGSAELFKRIFCGLRPGFGYQAEVSSLQHYSGFL
jgi:hypothetical protein